MSESPTRQEHVNAVVAVQYFRQNDSRRKSDGGSIGMYRVVRFRKRRSRSLTDLRQQFESSNTERCEVPQEHASCISVVTEQSANEDNIPTQRANNRGPSQLELRLYTIITFLGFIVIVLLMFLCYLYISKDISEGKFANAHVIIPKHDDL